MFHHRSGKLKQENKPHKNGKHATKNSLKKKNKGNNVIYKKIIIYY